MLASFKSSSSYLSSQEEEEAPRPSGITVVVDIMLRVCGGGGGDAIYTEDKNKRRVRYTFPCLYMVGNSVVALPVAMPVAGKPETSQATVLLGIVE